MEIFLKMDAKVEVKVSPSTIHLSNSNVNLKDARRELLIKIDENDDVVIEKKELNV